MGAASIQIDPTASTIPSISLSAACLGRKINMGKEIRSGE